MSDLQSQLTAYVDGELPEDVAREVVAKIEADPEIARTVADLKQIRSVLQSETPHIPVTGFNETLASIRVGTPLTEEARQNRPFIKYGQFALVGVIALVLIVPAVTNFNPGMTAPATEMASKSAVAGQEKAMLADAVAPAASGISANELGIKSDPSASRRSDAATGGTTPTESVLAKEGPASDGLIYLKPTLGPVLPPQVVKGPGPSRAPGSGERPLMALKDPSTTMEMPPTRVAGRLPGAGPFNGPVVPMVVEPLPGTASFEMRSPSDPTSISDMEAQVRAVVSAGKGTIGNVNRANGESKFTVSLDGSTADAVILSLRKILGNSGSVLSLSSFGSDRMASKAVAPPGAAADEASPEDLQKQLADKRAKREEMLRDFYEDAKPVKEIDTEIADLEKRLKERTKVAAGKKQTIVVTVKAPKQ